MSSTVQGQDNIADDVLPPLYWVAESKGLPL